MSEPVWRKVLCWGSVMIFVITPPALLALQILDQLNPRDIEVAKSMAPMYVSVTGLVVALAGLGTWQNIKNGPNKKQDSSGSVVPKSV